MRHFIVAKPFEATHRLVTVGEVITDEGDLQARSWRSLVAAGYIRPCVMIDGKPVEGQIHSGLSEEVGKLREELANKDKELADLKAKLEFAEEKAKDLEKQLSDKTKVAKEKV